MNLNIFFPFFSVSVSLSMSARPDAKLAMPAGSSTGEFDHCNFNADLSQALDSYR